MIGHYLAKLTPEQEDRVLTGKMGPGFYRWGDGSRCLVGWVEPEDLLEQRRVNTVDAVMHYALTHNYNIETAYDGLCKRFTTERTNRVIRERILRSRLRRALGGVRLETVKTNVEAGVA